MDSQPHLAPEIPAKKMEMSCLLIGAPLLPTNEYSTSVSIFPGTSAYPWFNIEGEFSLVATVYENSKPAGIYSSERCNELGNIRFSVETIEGLTRQDQHSLAVINLHQTKRVPVDVYFSAVHRKTGVYISYPGMPFVGDRIFPHVHAQQLENTTFWPGLLESRSTDVCIAILNPYDCPFFFQIHLIQPDGQRLQSDTIKARSISCSYHSVKELFGNDVASISAATSICVCSQFKHLAYVMFKDAATGVFTSIDHTHNYQML